MINPKAVGAKVEYNNVKIINIEKNKIVWEGKLDYEFKEEDTFYDSPVIYSLRALKSANDKFVHKLVYLSENGDF